MRGIRRGIGATLGAWVLLAACVGEDPVAPTFVVLADSGSGIDGSGGQTPPDGKDGAVSPPPSDAGDVDAPVGPAQVELLTPQLDFGEVDVAASARRSVRLKNRSITPITLSKALIGSPDFQTSSDGCSGVSLAPNAECAIDIELHPSAYGEKLATLDLSVDGVVVAKPTLRGVGRDTVVVEVDANADGTVSGSGIDCGATCAVTFTRALTVPTVTLTAAPSASSLFSAWTGVCAGVVGTSCSVPIGDAANGEHLRVGTIFDLLRPLKLVIEGGPGTAFKVTSTPAAIDTTVSGTFNGLFPPSTKVTLEVSTLDAYRFVGCPDADRTKCSVTMDGAATVRLKLTHHNYAFVSSVRYPGDLGGLDGADAKCAALAATAELPGHFRAWLSTSTIAAKTRFPGGGGLVRVDGSIVATTLTDMLATGRVRNPLWLDEMGALQGDNEDFFGERVWTGTFQNGDAESLHCDGWTKGDGATSGYVGATQGGLVGWSAFNADACSVGHRLYCFADDLTNPVPLPLRGSNRVVFVTNSTISADAGRDAMDARCAQEASDAGLTGEFIALVAIDGASASSRLPPGAPWVRVDGVPVSKTVDEFSTAPWIAQVDLTAKAEVLGTEVFTGYRRKAAAFSTSRVFSELPGAPTTCGNWGSVSSSEYAGVAQTAYAGFRSVGYEVDSTTNPPTCATPKGLYCVQK